MGNNPSNCTLSTCFTSLVVFVVQQVLSVRSNSVLSADGNNTYFNDVSAQVSYYIFSFSLVVFLYFSLSSA